MTTKADNNPSHPKTHRWGYKIVNDNNTEYLLVPAHNFQRLLDKNRAHRRQITSLTGVLAEARYLAYDRREMAYEWRKVTRELMEYIDARDDSPWKEETRLTLPKRGSFFSRILGRGRQAISA